LPQNVKKKLNTGSSTQIISTIWSWMIKK
jgi:hypothetical protein